MRDEHSHSQAPSTPAMALSPALETSWRATSEA
jgi:hypothetical protein